MYNTTSVETYIYRLVYACSYIIMIFNLPLYGIREHQNSKRTAVMTLILHECTKGCQGMILSQLGTNDP